MSEAAERFAAEWIRENVVAGQAVAPGDIGRAQFLAGECQEDARTAGIHDTDLAEAVRCMVGGADGLLNLMAKAVESASEDEINCLVQRDA